MISKRKYIAGLGNGIYLESKTRVNYLTQLDNAAMVNNHSDLKLEGSMQNEGRQNRIVGTLPMRFQETPITFSVNNDFGKFYLLVL